MFRESQQCGPFGPSFPYTAQERSSMWVPLKSSEKLSLQLICGWAAVVVGNISRASAKKLHRPARIQRTNPMRTTPLLGSVYPAGRLLSSGLPPASSSSPITSSSVDQVPSGRGTEEDFPMLLHDEHGCEITGGGGSSRADHPALTGSRPDTVVPRPGCDRTSRLPPSAARRSAMFWRPAPVGVRSGSKPFPSSLTSNVSSPSSIRNFTRTAQASAYLAT